MKHGLEKFLHSRYGILNDKIFHFSHISSNCSDKQISVKHKSVTDGNGLNLDLAGNDECLGSRFSIRLSRLGVTEFLSDVDTKNTSRQHLIQQTDLSCAPCSLVVWSPDFESLVKASDPVDVWFGMSKLDL